MKIRISDEFWKGVKFAYMNDLFQGKRKIKCEPFGIFVITFTMNPRNGLTTVLIENENNPMLCELGAVCCSDLKNALTVVEKFFDDLVDKTIQFIEQHRKETQK